MACKKLQSIWQLAADQHGVVSRTQLLERGLSRSAIEHRLARGRLHRVGQGVYAVGRRQVGRHGAWMAAVLSCGEDAALSHETAGALWGICPASRPIEVSTRTYRRRTGVVVHRRADLEVTHHQGIPVTPPVFTLVDIAARLTRDALEAAINAADKRDLVDPDSLRAALHDLTPRAGLARLRETLDRRTFVLTESALERYFLPLARRAGLPRPLTAQIVNGYMVDFYWPNLGLVVETDGLRYHRTPAQQAKDRLRDQAHAAAGLTHLRFTHDQVRYRPGHVQETLTTVARLLLRKPVSWQTPPRE
jgi:very-short-patch-repair endonuclease